MVGKEHKWYLYQDGKKYGPYNETHLRTFIREGRTKEDALIWRKGMKSWEKIAEVESFQSYFGKPRIEPIGEPAPLVKPTAGVERNHKDGRAIKVAFAVVVGILVTGTVLGYSLYSGRATDYQNLKSDYQSLESNYNNALSQKSSLLSQINSLESQRDSLNIQVQQALAYLQAAQGWVR